MCFKKIMKRTTSLALAAALTLVLAACGKENEPAAAPEPVTEPAGESAAEPEAASEEAPAEVAAEAAAEETAVSDTAAGEGYIGAYRTLVKEMSDSGKADQFMLAKIDGDEIWELLASNSEGPLDQENTFIYTAVNDEPVLLASAIAGTDGASLSYSDKNMIRRTGSVAGMADVYSSITDGTLKEEFRAEMINTLETDAAGDEIFSYTVNGKEVSREEYEKQLADFNKEYAPFVVIDYDGLNVMDFENGAFTQKTQLAYWTAEDTFTELDSVAKNEAGAVNSLAIAAPGYTGLSHLRSEDNADGTYYYEDMTEDGITLMTNMSYPNSQRDGQAMDAYAENFVCAQVDNNAVIKKTVEDPELSAKFTYPVYKISWESGSNEDTKEAVGIVVLTDKYTFYFGYRCSVDDYEENAEFYDEELHAAELIDLNE